MGKKTKSKNKNQTSAPSSPLACVLPNALYLAPVSVTGNVDLLKHERITHVISIGKNPLTRVDGITYHKFGLLDDEDAGLIPVVDKVSEILDVILPPPPPPPPPPPTAVALFKEGEQGGARETGEQEDAQESGESDETSKEKNIDTATPTRTSGQDNAKGQEQPQSRVLIHCSAAISRSPAVVAGYLMKSRGMSLRESLVALVKAREVVSPNVGFLRQLCQLERQVFGLGEGEEGTFEFKTIKGGTKLRILLEL